jgi:hypothetical protein
VSTRLENSKRPNTYRVGKSLLASILPRPAADEGDVMMKGPDGVLYGMVEVANKESFATQMNVIRSRQQPMFLFIPEGSNKSDYCGPHFVFPGHGAMAGVQFFPRILTDAEIQALYNRHRPVP